VLREQLVALLRHRAFSRRRQLRAFAGNNNHNAARYAAARGELSATSATSADDGDAGGGLAGAMQIGGSASHGGGGGSRLLGGFGADGPACGGVGPGGARGSTASDAKGGRDSAHSLVDRKSWSDANPEVRALASAMASGTRAHGLERCCSLAFERMGCVKTTRPRLPGSRETSPRPTVRPDRDVNARARARPDRNVLTAAPDRFDSSPDPAPPN